ncbi:lysostaphin resistance A-like protein [Candidatus Omnitrophota bacterium]
MKKIFDIAWRNKLYIFLIAFIVGINLLVFAGWMAERSEVKTESAVGDHPLQPEGKKIFDREDIEVREKKLRELATEDPPLYLFLGALNLTILFVILIGLILDIYFLMRWFRKRSIGMQRTRQESPRWSIGDVVRVTLIFISFGYAFTILQAFVAKLFPILYNENFRMVFNTAIMNVVGISVILYFVAKKYGQNIDTLGLTSSKFANNVFYAVVGYIALVPVLLVIMIATFFVTKLVEYQPPIQPIVQVFIEEKDTSVLWLSALFAAIFGPIAEEIFFRGFMYTAIRKRLGVFWAMMTTATIFSLLHTHIVGFLPIMVLGLLLAYLYEKTGSLVTSISVHIIHNLGMVMLVFLMRYVGV